MNRVIRQARLVPTPRPWRVGAAGRDPEWEAELTEATAAAYERGRADGAAQERGDGLALAAAIGEALAAAAAARRREVEDQAAVLTRSALDLAEAILGHAPHDDGAALEARVRAAVAELDDAPVEVAVHPVDAERLRAVTAADTRLELAIDASLQPGEARLRGRWAEAELTRAAAMEAARAALA